MWGEVPPPWLYWGTEFSPPVVYPTEPGAGFSEEDTVDMGTPQESGAGSGLPSRLLCTLKEKTSPELSLSSQDLEVGENPGP